MSKDIVADTNTLLEEIHGLKIRRGLTSNAPTERGAMSAIGRSVIGFSRLAQGGTVVAAGSQELGMRSFQAVETVFVVVAVNSLP
jgi:hypothetical protein